MQVGPVASVGLKPSPPVDTDDLDADSVAIHVHDQIMIRVVAEIHPWTHNVIQRHLFRLVGLQICAQVRLATIEIERRSASAGCDVIEPVLPACAVFVALDPMLEQMLVPADRIAAR